MKKTNTRIMPRTKRTMTVFMAVDLSGNEKEVSTLVPISPAVFDRRPNRSSLLSECESDDESVIEIQNLKSGKTGRNRSNHFRGLYW